MGNKLQVEIFGNKYTLRGDADEEYVKALASYVDEKMGEIAAHTPDNLLSKLAILTSINITHELFQLRSDQKERAAVIGGKTRDLIESIEEQFDAFKLEGPSSS
ncbi:MAG: cell division protein ZapA [Nitrospira sp.]|nr:cell division protein ZapA [Candidatus Manganitrophaceae bacterium]HIL34792.1 cell division protein ZapA [Candidatus Manganitrophaceae bacterium]